MITGLTDLASIERVYRQCWLRGLEILSARGEGTVPNPAVISLLERVKEESHKIG